MNTYHDWFDVNQLIQPKRPMFIQCDSTTAPPQGIETIYVQVEPEAIHPCNAFLRANSHLFKYVLTYDTDVAPNAYNHTFGSVWVKPHDYETTDTGLKTFQISMVCGSKSWTVGHKLRHEVYVRQLEFNPNITIFRSNRGGQYLPNISNNIFLPDDNKINLFKHFQYSIVIENSKQSNYFTEKLIDCLITKTIPIYWGCPNISSYFDTTGWILFDTVDDVKQKLSTIDTTTYDKYKDIIDANYERAKNHADFLQNINRVLETLPDY